MREFKGHPIMARIKAKPMNRTNTYNTPKSNVAAANGFRQPTNAVTSPGQAAQLTPVSPPANMPQSGNSSLLSAHSSPGLAAGGSPGAPAHAGPPVNTAGQPGPGYPGPSVSMNMPAMNVASPPGQPMQSSQSLAPASYAVSSSGPLMAAPAHHGGGTVMVQSTATPTVTPSSTPNTNTTILGTGGVAASAGSGPGGPAPGPHYIGQQGGATQTYHIFLPTSQGQVPQYFPGGLLQAATAMPGYHAVPGAPYFTNFINPTMIPTNSEFLQTNFKSSNRGGHNNYKSRGRGGRGGGNNDRNTPGGSGSNSSQSSYTPNYQSYNPGPGQQFAGYGPSQQYAKNNGNRNNWETSSQHSNSSQKKFSSSSGSSVHEGSSVNNSVAVSPPGAGVGVSGPRLVQQQPISGYQPSQYGHAQPAASRHPGPAQHSQKTEAEYGGGGLPGYQYHTARSMQDTVQSKEFVSSNKRGRGGRGGSSRGRDDMSGYNSVPRGGHGGGSAGPPQRNTTHVYGGHPHPHQPRHNSGGVAGQGVSPAEQGAVQQPRPEPPRPAPEFNMKANDFPSLPGVPDPAPAAEPSRFLDVVKGTAKMKLDDDQETIPDDFIQEDCDESRSLGLEAAAEPASSVSPRPRSKNPSVSETPVVSVERAALSPVEAASPGQDPPAPPMVNGEVKVGGAKAGPPSSQERDSGSVSPRQQSLVSWDLIYLAATHIFLMFRTYPVKS